VRSLREAFNFREINRRGLKSGRDVQKTHRIMQTVTGLEEGGRNGCRSNVDKETRDDARSRGFHGCWEEARSPASAPQEILEAHSEIGAELNRFADRSIDRSVGRSVGCPGPAVFSVLARVARIGDRRYSIQAPASLPLPSLLCGRTGGSGIALQKLPITRNMRFLRAPSRSPPLPRLKVYRVNPSGPPRVISRVSSIVSSFRAAAAMEPFPAIAFPGHRNAGTRGRSERSASTLASFPQRLLRVASRLIRGCAALKGSPEIPFDQKSSPRPLKHCIDFCTAAKRIDHPRVREPRVCACTRRIQPRRGEVSAASGSRAFIT